MTVTLNKCWGIATGVLLTMGLMVTAALAMDGCPKDKVPGPVTVTMSGNNILRIVHCIPIEAPPPGNQCHGVNCLKSNTSASKVSSGLDEVPVPHIKHVPHGAFYKASTYVVSQMSRLSPDISDTSITRALARAKELLREKGNNALFAVFGPEDMAAKVAYNATKMPDTIFPKISEAAALNANPNFSDQKQANDYGNQLTVKSVRTLYEVDAGDAGEVAQTGRSGETLFSATFPKAAAVTDKAVQTAPTWTSDIRSVIGLWAPPQPTQKKDKP